MSFLKKQSSNGMGDILFDDEMIHSAPPWRIDVKRKRLDASYSGTKPVSQMFVSPFTSYFSKEGFTYAWQFDPWANSLLVYGTFKDAAYKPSYFCLSLRNREEIVEEVYKEVHLPTGFSCKGLARLSKSTLLVSGNVFLGTDFVRRSVVVYKVNGQTGEFKVVWTFDKSDPYGGELMNVNDNVLCVRLNQTSLALLKLPPS